ncbi:MAG: phospholipase D-like domain-containing protein [Thermoplasmatota archaeon]
MDGNYSIELMIIGQSIGLEINGSNNRASFDITIIPSVLPPGMRGIAISEILWNVTEKGRYLKIENPTDDPIDLSWAGISDGTDHAFFPENTFIGAGGTIGIAWGDEGESGTDDADLTFRIDGSGPVNIRMALDGDAPDPSGTGVVSFISRYRHDIDTVSVRSVSRAAGFVPVDDCHIETTYGTTMFRRRDVDGFPIDTNTSLDWNVISAEVQIQSFMPRPGSDGTGELIIIRSEIPGSDISGCTLLCGGYLATIPNGTYTDENGEIVISRDPAAYYDINGFLPDLCTDWNTNSDGGSIIPGCRISGYPELIMPDDGGTILLLDPGRRAVDCVSWGHGSDMGIPPRNSIIGRITDGSDAGPVWKLTGTGTSPDTSKFNSGSNRCNFTILPDLASALSWAGTEGDLRIWSSFVEDIQFAEAVSIHLDDGFDVEMIYLNKPWSEVSEILGGAEAREDRVRTASFLGNRGARIYHLESNIHYDPATIIRGGRRIILSLYSPGASMGGCSFPVVFGYEFPSPCAAEEMLRMIIPDGITQIHDSRDFLDLMDATSDPEGEFASFPSGAINYNEPDIFTDLDISVIDPLDPVSDLLPEDQSTILYSSGEIDFTSILRKLKAGDRIRLIISPGWIRPYPGGPGSFYESVEGRIGSGDHLLSLQDLREDQLVRASAALSLSRDRGYDLGIRVAPPILLNNIGGNLLISGGTASIGMGSLDPGFPSRMVRIPLCSGMIKPSSMEDLWTDSIDLPIFMSGYLSSGDPPEEVPVRIQEIYYDTYLANDPDEYLSVSNFGSESVDLSGFTISDDEGSGISSDGTVMLGPGSRIEAGETLYIAMNGSAFHSQHGFEPDASWIDSRGKGTAVLISGFMRLGNGNDTVCLRDSLGRVVDVVPYGSSFWKNDSWQSLDSGRWSGRAAPDIGWGRILRRSTTEDQITMADTNSALDWISVRPYHPGQSRFSPFESRSVDSARIGICPDSSSPLLNDLIRSASSELLVNVYELTSEWITSSLIGARSRGVDVRLILEGNPVGGMSYSEKCCLNRLTESGVLVRLMTTDIQNGIRDRYRYDHAKYVVRDQKEVFVSSDNFKDSSFPREDEICSSGTRGWTASVESTEMAADLASVFESDWDGPDMIPWVPDGGVKSDTLPTDAPMIDPPIGLQLFDDIAVRDARSAEIVVSPDHLGELENSIINAIRNAKSEILLELMDIKEHFDTPVSEILADFGTVEAGLKYPGRITSNPYLDEIFRASNRGVDVKLILDGSDFDGDSVPDNGFICDWINEIASSSDLSGNLSARLHPAPRYHPGQEVSMIHNKGMIIDRKEVWISSFNWGPTSAVENREVGVLLVSEEAGEYLRSAFLLDWGSTLQSDLDLSAGHLKCSRSEEGLNRYSMDVSVNHSLADPIDILIVPLEIIEMNGYIGANGSIENVSVAPGGTRRVTLSWEGEDSSDYVLIIRSEERIMPYMIIRGDTPAEIGGYKWNYPWHREPIIPILIILVISLGISSVISIVSYAMKAGKNPVLDGTFEE